ncbi:hypothetical protein E5288_WYG013620 [Bos mutus]|uniref:Uncharacterized protein n=1 Tax=Bos mutus TaxID=72004 RepID=A0A6B0QU19_9CETA|nr:hypothetical protein [Bos mutus]
MKVLMLRDKNGEIEAQVSAQTDAKGGGAAPVCLIGPEEIFLKQAGLIINLPSKEISEPLTTIFSWLTFIHSGSGAANSILPVRSPSQVETMCICSWFSKHIPVSSCGRDDWTSGSTSCVLGVWLVVSGDGVDSITGVLKARYRRRRGQLWFYNTNVF